MRPSKRTDERIERILSAIRAGNTIRAACGAGGISVETFASWRRSDPQLRDDVMAAEAAAEFIAVNALRDGFADDWRAAQAWLERRRPEDWGRADRLRLEAATGAGADRPLRITLDLGDPLPEDAAADDTPSVGGASEDEENLRALFPGEYPAAPAPPPRERPQVGTRPKVRQ